MPEPPVAAASPSASEVPPRSGTGIYLDNLATTPLDPRVLEAMLPFFSLRFGNPSSRTHPWGWDAAEAVEAARSQVAALLAAAPREIVFTSGATEANNLALRGVAEAADDGRDHLVTCATEHHAVLDVLAALERTGRFRVTRLAVDSDGIVDLTQLESALDDGALLLSVMAANNETGALQPLAEIGRLVAPRGVVWHCDAAQAVGKIPIDLRSLPIDLLSLSAHKIHGPKGVGALFVRRRRPPLRLAPQQLGGGQERGLRSGTLNVPGIVGLGEACRLCAERMVEESRRTAALRDRLQHHLQDRLGADLRVNGPAECRLPNALNLSFLGVNGTELLLALRDVALSSGAACTSGTAAPSHVLQAMGRDAATAAATLRFGLGRFTTPDEIERAAERVAAEVLRCRSERGASVSGPPGGCDPAVCP